MDIFVPSSSPTLFLQVHPALGNDDWDVTIYVALAIFVDKRDGDIRIGDALSQWDAEDTLWFRIWRGWVSHGL